MKKIFALCLVFLLAAVFMCGCSIEKQDKDKIKDVEYTVVDNADIPDVLMQTIEAKKQQVFKTTYQDEDYLYIVVGYGTQPTGGYSITLDDLYLTKNAIYVDTTLIGPSKDEKVSQAETYPYIVIKTEYVDTNIVFK